jgi:hypothetical protein
MPVETDPADNDIFHTGGFLLCDRAGALLKARPHLEFDPEFLREFHCARLHHFRAAASHLK